MAHDVYYANLLLNNQPGFLNTLNRNIIKGDNSKVETLKILGIASRAPLCKQLLLNFRDEFDDCLIHNVAKFHQSTNVLKNLVAICPRSVFAQRTDRFLGQTALHIVVTKGNLKATRAILGSVPQAEDLSTLLHVKATGSLFANTVMMGELALSVAALTLNTNIVDALIKHGAQVSQQNTKGDTVFHSLIRYAVIHPENIEAILKMIKHINSHLSSNEISRVWYHAENSEELTALKLAAALGQVEIFSSILKMEDVYCKLNHHDGLFDVYLFDITEIDTITQAEWERNTKRQSTDAAKRRKSVKDEGFNFKQSVQKKQPAAQSHRPALIHKRPSVLDIVCRLPTATAFQLMNVDAVSDLIKTKWTHYRKFYYLWCLLHLLAMSLITAYAVYKTEVINDRIYSDKNNHTGSDSFDVGDTTERFVFVTSFLCVVYAAPYLIYEAFRSFYFKQSWHLEVIHHNGLYRLMLLTMSLSLVIDSILFWIDPDNNYFLVIALLIGWTFMNFFLRAIKIFSFFTVMLQKVLLGDMTRFSVIIIFQLIAFSFAMYITFLNTHPVPEGFGNIGMTILTMFKLMLGLTDIEILYDARHSWMAIFLFISCVLVTYVLLINSLIALMSQTCALVSEDRRMQWELQRLSVIHLVETMLFPRWRYLHKPGLKARRYNLEHNQSLEWRCFHEITSIQTTYTDGAALLRRKSMIRTIGFGDSGLSPMAPLIDRFRIGRHPASWNSLSPIYQSPGSLRGVGTIAEENGDDSTSEEEDESAISHFKPLKSIPTQIAVGDRTNETSDKLPARSKQTKTHSSNDNGKEMNLSQFKKSRTASDENFFFSSPSSSSSSYFCPEDISNSNNNNSIKGHRKKDGKPLEQIKSEQKHNNQNQQSQQHFLKPDVAPEQPLPRKRHNSERVNRKTQTPQQGGELLSHSYPDSGLRTPLRQSRSGSVGVQLQPQQQTVSQQTTDNNPRIVYVVPSSAFANPGIISDLSQQPQQYLPTQYPIHQSDQILQQIVATATAATTALPEIRVQQPLNEHGLENTAPAAASKSSASTTTTNTVQKLDIGTLHSSA